jgi:hypothetical protein
VNSLVTLFLLVNAAALLLVPRRWTPLPFLVGTCYIPFYLGIELGLFHFSPIRILIAIGVVRIAVRGEWPVGRMNRIDWAMLAWAAWMLVSSLFHEVPTSALIFRLGLVYDACGAYALIRGFCRSLDDVSRICQLTAILLVPLAVEMLYEKQTVHNLFSILGGVDATPEIRAGTVRANGPFGHAILVGTVGATCLPLMIGVWRMHRKRALVGIMACLTIIFCSGSSGPVMSMMAGIFALFMWHYRSRIRVVQWLAVLGYIALDLIMRDPAYFLIARIDLAGGSTGWYRARLIQSAIEHLPEWWLAGTDHTSHWMWVVMRWSSNHTDITSYYIQMGVWGGLPLLFLFIIVLANGFSGVKQARKQATDPSPESQFMLWAVGSSLFAHAATFFSVSYFDQSFVLLYLTLGSIGSAWSVSMTRSTIPSRTSGEGDRTVTQRASLALTVR